MIPVIWILNSKFVQSMQREDCAAPAQKYEITVWRSVPQTADIEVMATSYGDAMGQVYDAVCEDMSNKYLHWTPAIDELVAARYEMAEISGPSRNEEGCSADNALPEHGYKVFDIEEVMLKLCALLSLDHYCLECVFWDEREDYWPTK